MEKPTWSIGAGYTVFPYLAHLFGLKVFIETGTSFGQMLSYLHPSFDRLYSIEKYEWAYKVSSAILAPVEKIHLICGDSGIELPKLLQSIPNEPSLFWLDAHGNIAERDAGPIAEEIEAIVKYRPDSLIAVDDVGPGRHHDVEFFNHSRLDGWVKDYRFGCIMFLHKGQFEIPDLGD